MLPGPETRPEATAALIVCGMMRVLRTARLFDGSAGHLVENALVFVDGGRIAAVESGHVEPPVDADVVELGDVTLLPGLIDGHVHLGFDASRDPVAQMRA